MPWKLFIPADHRPIGFETIAYYHPTFLYESLWDLGVLTLLLWTFKRFPNAHPGTLTCLYAVAYSLGRLWVEGLRTDSLMAGPLRVAQLVSLLGIVGGTVGLWWLSKRNQKPTLPGAV